MAKKLNRKWTDEDLALLIELADHGVSLLRATAALKRPAASVKRKAHELGKTLPGSREVRSRLRAAGAMEQAVRR
jgi:hypothetical protein